jgi:hypothetical protein
MHFTQKGKPIRIGTAVTWQASRVSRIFHNDEKLAALTGEAQEIEEPLGTLGYAT